VMYTLQGRHNMLNAKFAEMQDWLDTDSVFSPLDRYSPAYVRHLVRAKEPLGARLLTLHNLNFYARLMREIREAITEGTWRELRSRYANA